MKVRKSSNIARIVKGDTFIDPIKGDLVTATSFPMDRRDDGTVSLPVQVDGAMRSSRRRLDASLRVKLL